ncbi:type IX secretion system membrane protein PorP/SprF [Flagellimonas sp.]|uniref:PorP/SprF family type IX secretion system membrane protein n=1 Tax=Flagellimonas sp. TaxID=2058762 RepID=UPI003AB3879F
MKFKTIYLALTVVLVSGISYAQQDPNFTFYRYNMNLVNPAYAGANEGTDVGLGIRSQWAGIEGSPETQTIYFGTPVGRNLGLGVSIINDRTFIENQTSVALDFSYHLQLNVDTHLFLGLKAGLNSYKANTDGLVTYGIQSDPSLTGINGGFTPNVGVGAYLKGTSFFASLSVPRLLTPDRLDNANGVAIQGEDKIHLYAAAGYDIPLNADILFKPAFMVRHVEASPLSIDFTAAFALHEKFELGAAYRLDEGFGGFFVFKPSKGLHLGYAYETASQNTVANMNNGTHEIMLNLKL